MFLGPLFRFVQRQRLDAASSVYNGSYSSQIDSVLSDKSFHDTMADTVQQQIVNGRYGTVEMLEIIAREKDVSE